MHNYNSLITIPNNPNNSHLVCFDRIFSELNTLNISNFPFVDENSAALSFYLNTSFQILQNLKKQYSNIKIELLDEPIVWDD